MQLLSNPVARLVRICCTISPIYVQLAQVRSLSNIIMIILCMHSRMTAIMSAKDTNMNLTIIYSHRQAPSRCYCCLSGIFCLALIGPLDRLIGMRNLPKKLTCTSPLSCSAHLQHLHRNPDLSPNIPTPYDSISGSQRRTEKNSGNIHSLLHAGGIHTSYVK